MPTHAHRVALAAAAIAAALAIATPAASAATRTVCATGCEATTIAAGVAAASPGDTVTVGPGSYPLAAPVTIDKPLTLAGPNAGISPNALGAATSANPARGPEATITVTGATQALNLAASGITVDGLRFTNTGAAAADVNAPLIGAAGVADTTLVNTLFDGISRTAVSFNGPTPMVGATVDDNRVAVPTRPGTGCAGTVAPGGCGHALFNLWKTSDLSFSGNAVLASAGNGDRVRVLNLESSSDVTVAGNTIRNSCTYTCVTIAGSTTDVRVSANDVAVDVGNVVLFYSTWSGGTVAITGNRFLETGTDFAIGIDNPAADLSGVDLARNALLGGAVRNDSAQPLAATCNWFGAGTGPSSLQLQGPATTSPFLTGVVLAAACPELPPPYVAPAEPDTPPTPQPPAPTTPQSVQEPSLAAPVTPPTPSEAIQARDDAKDALGAPAKRDAAFDLGGAALVFVPTNGADRSDDTPLVSGGTVRFDRDALDSGNAQSLLAVSCPTTSCVASFEMVLTYTDAKGRRRTVKLTVPDQDLGAGETAVLNLALPRAVRKLLLAGTPVKLRVGIGVDQADGSPIGADTRTFSLKTDPKPKPKGKSKGNGKKG